MRRGLFSVEGIDGLDQDLELVQLLQREEQAKEKGDFDILQQKTEEKLKLEADKVSEEDDQTTTDETVDSSSDSDDLGDADGDTDETTTAVAQESLRDEFHSHRWVMALETSDLYGAEEVSRSTLSAAAHGIMEFIRFMVPLGLRVIPAAVSGFGKATLYMGTRILRSFYKVITTSEDFFKEHQRSFKRSKDQIRSLQETIKLLEESTELKDVTRRSFTDHSSLQYFSMGRDVGVEKSLEVIRRFMQGPISQIGRGIQSDVSIIQRLIDVVNEGQNVSIDELMEVELFSSSLTARNIKGYGVDSEHLQNYVYPQTLPGNFLFFLQIPKSNLPDMEAWSDAYRHSNMSIGMNLERFQVPESIDYVALDSLKKLLRELDAFCDVCLAQKTLYQEVERSSQKLRLGYRHYFEKLIGQPDRINLQKSLAEHIYLKQAFVGKVYVAGMMDVHKYAATYVQKVLRYVKENLNTLG